MSEYDRGNGPSSHKYQQQQSLSGQSPTRSRTSHRHARQEESLAEATTRRDDMRRLQNNNTQEEYLSPSIPATRRGRLRVDSLSSLGSSVAPGALPSFQGRSHPSSRHQNRESSTPSTSAANGNAGGGLEAWLLNQSSATNGGTSLESFPSFAPSNRIRRMDAVDEADIGSDAGRSTGARSAGPKIYGKDSGRSNRERQKRLAIPEWDPAAMEYEAAYGPDAQKLENVLRWRKDSTARSTTKERNDLSDLDQIGPDIRRNRREGAGSFSASGLSVLREGVRRPRKPNAEPSLDALLSTSMTGQTGTRISSSHSFGGNSVAAGSTLGTHDRLMNTRDKERFAEGSAISPLRSFVRWFLLEGNAIPAADGAIEEGGMILMTLMSVLLSVLFKWIIGLGSWSGKGSPPMFGDFEAQRHWMEITLHLPRSQWYHYDLQYWGLDYPPLTALVSQLCAQVASLVPGLAPSLALDTSRGNEDPLLVIFMRASVLVLDLVIYTPAILFFLSRKLQGRGRRTRAITFITVLLQPTLLLVDYGHFQYNTVMLGLSAAAFALLYTSLPNPSLSSSPSSKTDVDGQKQISSLSQRISYEYIAAAVCFSLSLGFKQMALYYAPAIFAIMLGRCWGLARIGVERGLICFFGLGLATIVTFAGMFHPWLTDLSQLGQIIHRIFPVARGIFEDKVSNIWCFLSVLPIPAQYKLRNVISGPTLARVSLITTVLMILLPCVHLFAAAAETVRIEVFLNQDIRRQLLASEKRRVEGSIAGSSRARRRKAPHAAPSETGSDLASILSGNRGCSGTAASTVGGADTTREVNMSTGTPIVASSSPSPAASILPYALLSTSLAFFLFGFQTHEKSILLPLLPITLLITTKGDEYGGGAGKIDWEWAVLTNNLAVFSIWPLLQRDGLSLQYVTLILLWNWSIGFQPFSGLQSHRQSFVAWFGAVVHLAMINLHLLEVLFPLLPNHTALITSRYPDLFAVFNVLLCTPCFMLVWLWSTKRQLEVGFACGIDILSLQKGRGYTTKSNAKADRKV
ncbi:hypothetical protein CBS101457_006154 [Exobasidium rhododendri]|nr:hypothetical protein CBS101457_006154 [Exobasidium rhododendri]